MTSEEEQSLEEAKRKGKMLKEESEQIAREQERRKASITREKAIEEEQERKAAERREKRASEEREQLAKEQERKKANLIREQAIADAREARKLKDNK